MSVTPHEFAARLAKAPATVRGVQRRALRARAGITKRAVLATAAAAGGLGHKVRQNWVRITDLGSDDNPVAKLALHDGFAVLTERGSYKKRGGYEIGSKKGQRRLRSAQSRRARSGRAAPIDESRFAGFLGNESRGFAASGSVHHPAQHPHPFFEAGLAASRRPGYDAYAAVTLEAVRRALT